jgi:hypothetical protein
MTEEPCTSKCGRRWGGGERFFLGGRARLRVPTDPASRANAVARSKVPSPAFLLAEARS